MTDKRVREIIGIVTTILSKHLDRFDLYLFGSRSKGCNFKHSDIDLAVETECTEDIFYKIKEEIDNIDTLYSIDLVHLNKIEQDFKKIILETGKHIHTYEK